MLAFADSVLLALGAYIVLGTGFAILFATWGAQTIDPAAKGMPISARLLILPGSIVLWPVLLVKWLRRQSPPVA